jgi:predicted amidohydrolase
MDFKMALVQMFVAGGDQPRNLRRAEELIAEAAAHGSRLVVLPEAMDLGWTHPSSRTAAEPVPDGEPCRRLAECAASHGIHLCAGLTERRGDQVFNSAVILGKAGELLCLHRKIHELEIGHPFYAQGDRLNVAATELGTLGLMICADGFAKDQVLSRSLCYMGADILLSPCAWAVPADHDHQTDPYGVLWKNCYRPVAQEFRVWIAGVSNVGPITAGPWAGRKCIGCSLVVGPDGAEVAEGPYGVDAETILYVDVKTDRRPARGCGWTEYWSCCAATDAPPGGHNAVGYSKDKGFAKGITR